MDNTNSNPPSDNNSSDQLPPWVPPLSSAPPEPIIDQPLATEANTTSDPAILPINQPVQSAPQETNPSAAWTPPEPTSIPTPEPPAQTPPTANPQSSWLNQAIGGSSLGGVNQENTPPADPVNTAPSTPPLDTNQQPNLEVTNQAGASLDQVQSFATPDQLVNSDPTQNPEPQPTYPFTPSSDNQQSSTNLSAGQDNQPNFGPSSPNATNQPVQPEVNPPLPPLEPSEPAPTDLSQLSENPTSGAPTNTDIYNPSAPPPETLVVPSEPTPGVPESTSVEHHNKLPILAIIGAVIIILLVAGGSAYFILGIGKTNTEETTTSLPIEQPPLTNPPTPIASPTPAADQTDEATGSGSFGELNGNNPTPSPSSSGTSAIDRLRQKQSPSPTPASEE